MENSLYIENSYYRKDKDKFMTLLTLVDGKRAAYFRNKLNKEHKDILAWINDSLPMLNDNFYTLQTKIYWILNGFEDFPKCENPNCDYRFKMRNVKSIIAGYPRYCSHACAVNDEATKQKMAMTCLLRYNATSPGQNEEVKQKGKETCLKKYGVEYSFQSENNKLKTKNTLMHQYGVEHVSQIPGVSDKIKKTKYEKYGKNQPWHSVESMEKRKKTWMKTIGADSPLRSSISKKRYHDTLMHNYGVEYFSKSKQFKIQRATLSFNKFILNNENDEPLFTLDDYINRKSIFDKFEFKCRKCGEVFTSSHCNGVHRRCPKCFPVNKAWSYDEKQLSEFVKSLGVDVIENDRKMISPLELDIIAPQKNVAIEYDGMYWHSIQMKPDSAYHLHKTTLCESKGFQLIHVFENEWVYKQDIVKSRLKQIFGIHDHVVFARKCEVREVSSCDAMEFLENCHIQGSCKAKVRLGLYFNNELIALMTFGKSRFTLKADWELLRFCTKLNYHVPGAAGKLLKHFERKHSPKSLVSYADRRWSRGKLYEALGFRLDHISKPNYWYFNLSSCQMESRIKFQKHKLKNILEKFDESLSEQQNMSNNGYYCIYDCGNYVFLKQYN